MRWPSDPGGRVCASASSCSTDTAGDCHGSRRRWLAPPLHLAPHQKRPGPFRGCLPRPCHAPPMVRRRSIAGPVALFRAPRRRSGSSSDIGDYVVGRSPGIEVPLAVLTVRGPRAAGQSAHPRRQARGARRISLPLISGTALMSPGPCSPSLSGVPCRLIYAFHCRRVP